MFNHLIHTLSSLWSSIFPPSAHYLTVKAATLGDIRAVLNPQYQHGVTWLSSYHHPLVHACVASAKFEHNMRAVQLLGELVATHLKDKPTTILHVPIPLHKKRESTRGYNQVTVVLEAARKQIPLPMTTHLLKRTRNTNRQTSLGRKDRLLNMKGVFHVHKLPHDWSTYDTIMIWDDVYTTGATLQAAKAAITPHLLPHQEIVCVAFAH